jgi:geranylgeranyl diphosphate synthase, type I
MKPPRTEHAQALLAQAAREVDANIKKILSRKSKGPARRMYDMLQYVQGMLDEHLEPCNAPSGKRFRPALSLILADMYRARDQVRESALALELFHNFSLIHDDIEDRDEYRRGRPTLWKLFGVNHAINAGDSLLLIVSDMCASIAQQKNGKALSKALHAAFAQVIEGQYLDFKLATTPVNNASVNETHYEEMTARKTAALVATSAQIAGIASQQSQRELRNLKYYGHSLGLAFQIADDYRSHWSSANDTGKDLYGDIREHKRTLIFFKAYGESNQKSRLKALYELDRPLNEIEITEVRTLIDATSAREKVLDVIRAHVAAARKAAKKLSISEDNRGILCTIVDLFVPEARNHVA